MSCNIRGEKLVKTRSWGRLQYSRGSSTSPIPYSSIGSTLPVEKSFFTGPAGRFIQVCR